VIIGAHVIIYARDPEAARAFFRDVLGLPSVDAGRGWLIFELPPAELAAHPAEKGGDHELYLMCDDIELSFSLQTDRICNRTRGVADASHPDRRSSAWA
jgi:catechol 2,3-dioxygenase-like lactoylglutathione lyase family enzyme